MMNDSQRLKLNEMLSEKTDFQDNTTLIRKLKHSKFFLMDIETMLLIQNSPDKQHESADDKHIECMGSCNFLYTNYTDIYNKIRKDEIDINMLYEFIAVLKEIEDGTLDQHEASFKIGSSLKTMYVDSALRKSAKLDADKQQKIIIPSIDICWKDYKKLNLRQSCA